MMPTETDRERATSPSPNSRWSAHMYMGYYNTIGLAIGKSGKNYISQSRYSAVKAWAGGKAVHRLPFDFVIYPII